MFVCYSNNQLNKWSHYIYTTVLCIIAKPVALPGIRPPANVSFHYWGVMKCLSLTATL